MRELGITYTAAERAEIARHEGDAPPRDLLSAYFKLRTALEDIAASGAIHDARALAESALDHSDDGLDEL